MKTKEELYAALRTDFETRVGMPIHDSGDIAVRLWATAVQLESLYCYADWSRQQSFPQTATGEYLDYHGQTRGLERHGAVCAQGEVTFRLGTVKAVDVTIPKGTVVATAGQLLYQTDKACVIPAGATAATVSATCMSPGKCGNVAAGLVTELTQAPAGVISCGNAAPFSGGQDAEPDGEYRERILATYQVLSTGANAAYYYQMAMATPQVAACKVIPRPDGAGTVKVLITTKLGQPNEALRARLEAQFASAREISTVVTVAFPQQVDFSATVQILPKNGGDFTLAQEAVQAAVAAYFDGSLLGKSVYLTHLGQKILDTGLVENYVFSADSHDLQVTEAQLPCLKSLTVLEGA